MIDATKEHSEWKPGDWFLWETVWGDVRPMYILAILPGSNYAILGKDWLQSAWIVCSEEKLSRCQYIGTGKRNWLFGWIGFVRKYHKPEGMGWL